MSNVIITDDTINNLKKEVERLKGMKIKADARMEQLLSQKKELEKEVADMGYDPATLGEKLAEMGGQMQALLIQIEEVKPSV